MGFFKTSIGVLLSMLLIFSLSACAQTQSNTTNNKNSNKIESSHSIASDSEEAVSSCDEKKKELNKGEFFVIGIDGDEHIIKLKDTDTISHIFIGPLIANGQIWGYNWRTPSEIHADDLINFCAHANFWDYPKDFEGCYLPDQNTQEADLVEDKILEHFDVDRQYLKTSECYLPKNDVYALFGGWGGGWGAGALSADLQGNLLKIEVGYYTCLTEEEAEEYRSNPEKNQLSEGYYSPDRIISDDGHIVIPGGILTVRLDNGIIKYKSWIRRPDIDF